MSASLLWKNTPLLLPDAAGQLSNFMDQFQNFEDVLAFCKDGSSWQSDKDLVQFNYPNAPKPKLNTVVFPTGAARFAYFFGLASTAAVGNNGIPGTQGTLTLTDGNGGSQSFAMTVLGFHPITSISSVSLLILVDKRYFWQQRSCGDFVQALVNSPNTDGVQNDQLNENNLTWEQVFAQIGTRLSTTITPDAIDSNYGIPDIEEIIHRSYANCALLLDAVAGSVGQRIVVDPATGAVTSRSSSYYGSSLSGLTNPVAGDSSYRREPQPYALTVSFPRASQRHKYHDASQYITGQNNSSGSISDFTVTSSAVANWLTEVDDGGNDPDNISFLNGLTSAIYNGVFGWFGQQNFDRTWEGMKSISFTGYIDCVEWCYGDQISNNVYKLPNMEKTKGEAVPEAQFVQNYYRFYTRAWGNPSSFACNVNYSQDPAAKVLISDFYWGVSTTPENTDDFGSVQINIWNADSDGNDHNTGVNIKAYSLFSGTNYPAGSLLALNWNNLSRQWLFWAKDQIDIVKINGTGAVSGNSRCLWSGNVENINQSIGFCTNNTFTDSTAVWVMAINNPIPQKLKGGDRFLAKLVGTFSYGADTRPLYALRNDGSTGLRRFELIEDLTFGQNPTEPNAQVLVWDGSEYVTSGDIFTVYDWTNAVSGPDLYGSWSGFGQNGGIAGFQGWCQYNDDSQRWEIVWLENMANWIRFQLYAPMTPDESFGDAKVLDWWDGRNPFVFPQLLQTGTQTIRVFNASDGNGNGIWRAPASAVGFAVWNNHITDYVIIWIQKKPQFVTGKITSDFATGGTINGTVEKFWGMEKSVGLSTANNLVLLDPTSLFMGQKDAYYQATYSFEDDKYIITWVACPTAGATGP